MKTTKDGRAQFGLLTQKKVLCPYCGKEARWVENKEIYGRNYGKSFLMYWCKDCDARVGCHNNTNKPLGTMANKELRGWRMKAHEAFDPLWRETNLSRAKAYKLLNELENKKVHIAESDIDTCKRIIEHSINLKHEQAKSN